jgi:hypothetical protein
MAVATCFGIAVASTFRPAASAAFGDRPGPTPPFFAPSMALSSWSAPLQNFSSPKVSNRNVF